MPSRSRITAEIDRLRDYGVSSDLIVEARATLAYLCEKKVKLPASVVARGNGHAMFVYDGDVELEVGEREIVVVSPDMSEERIGSLREVASKLKKLLT